MRSVVVMQLVLYERLVLDLRFPQYPIHVSTSDAYKLSHTHQVSLVTKHPRQYIKTT